MAKKANGELSLEGLLSFIEHTTSNVGKIKTTTEYSKETSKIILPEGMSKRDAARDLQNQWENEEQLQDFQTILEGWEWKDGLRAVRNVMEEKFGWIKGGHASWFETPPTEVSIVTGYKKGKPIIEQGFMGKVKFPTYENCDGSIGVTKAGETYVTLKAKRKFSPQINTFFQELNVYLQNNSIYRGKPVVVTWKNERIDLEITELKVNDKIVLNEKERMVVDHFVLDQLGEQGKRCFLFTGDYGNGKSETAIEIGDFAVKKEISFFYLKQAALFSRVLSFAKKYEPCVLFVEDIDEIASGEDRDSAMNDILNTIDGVQTKGRNITVLFTTNHEKRINKALRRPGRIDLIINFANPTKDTAQKILEKLLEKFDGFESLDWDLIRPQLPEVQAAVIAEIGKRAARLATRHDNTIETEQIVAAVVSLEYQIQFMKEDTENADVVKASFDTIRKYKNYDLDFNS